MIALETLGDNSASDRNFKTLGLLVPDTGGRGINIRFGTKTFAWPGATATQSFTIPHGLGKNPTVVIAGNANNNTAGLPRAYSNGDGINFTLNVLAPANVAAAIADSYHWLAIG